MSTTTTHRPTSSRPTVVLAVLLHLGIAVFPLSSSGLLAPAWFLAATVGLWTTGTAVLRRLAHTRPRATALVPIAVLALWVCGILAGEHLLGWRG